MATQLANNFYMKSGWHDSLINHYSAHYSHLPENTLDAPIDMLVSSLEEVIFIYANFPDTLTKLLKQCYDPLYEPGEYKSQIYQSNITIAQQTNQPIYKTMAQALLNIRNLYEERPTFISENFPHAPENFDQIMRDITQTHIQQITQLIDEQ